MSVEMLAHGLSREWLDGGRIGVVTTSGTMAKDAVDFWESVVLEMLSQFPAGEPARIAHILHPTTERLTGYARRRTLDILTRLPDERALYSAYVVPDPLVNAVLEGMIRPRTQPLPNLTERIFSDRTTAIAWLRETYAV
jgi:hypothetical protein